MEEGFALLVVAEVHLKRFPLALLQDGHPPGATYCIADLPEYVIPLLISETFIVSLEYRGRVGPDVVLDCAENFPPVLIVGAAEHLKCVDAPNTGKIV